MKGSLPELAASSSSILQRQLLGWRSFHIPWSSLDTVLTVKHLMPLPSAFLGFARVSLLHLQEHRAGAASAGASKRIARDPPPPVALAGQALGLLSGGVGDARHHLRPNATGGTKNGKENSAASRTRSVDGRGRSNRDNGFESCRWVSGFSPRSRTHPATFFSPAKTLP